MPTMPRPTYPLTKGELRKLRKAARASGQDIQRDPTLRTDRDSGPVEWSESKAGNRARELWARMTTTFWSDNGAVCRQCEGTCYRYTVKPEAFALFARCSACHTTTRIQLSDHRQVASTGKGEG